MRKKVFMVVNMVENIEEEVVTDLYSSLYTTYEKAKQREDEIINEIKEQYNEVGYNYNIMENGDNIVILRGDNLEKHTINVVEKFIY
mgnify:FL=1